MKVRLTMKELNNVRYIYIFEFENMILVTDDKYFLFKEETGDIGEISQEKAEEFIDKYNYHIATGLYKDAWVKMIQAGYINKIIEK